MSLNMKDASYDAVRADDKEDEESLYEENIRLQNGERIIPEKKRDFTDLGKPSRSSGRHGRFLPVRYQLSFLSSIGMMSLGAMRQNLGVAVVAMVNTSYAEHAFTDDFDYSEEVVSCKEILDNGTDYDYNTSGEFAWSTHTQELLLAGFFYGYLCTQVPGGWISDKFGSKWVFGLGIMLSSVCSLLGPLAARTSTVLFFITRCLAGFGEGVVLPAVSSMWSQWAHPNERSRLSIITCSGTTIGLSLGSAIAGVVVGSDILGGWPLPFYIYGSLGCVWFTFWCLFASSHPSEHRWISLEEREYLEKSLKLQSRKSKVSVPWLSICRSPVVWVITFCQFIQGWGLFTIITNLPLYYNKGLGLSVQQTGLFSALPYALHLLGNVITAYIADTILSRKFLSVSRTRKLITDLSFGSCSLFLALAGLSRCNAALSVTFVTLAVGLNGAAYIGYYVSILDLAGSYAGSVSALASGAGSLGGVIGPLVVGELTLIQYDIFGWQSVLWIIAGLYLIAALAYTFVSPIILQPWARTGESSNDKDTETSRTRR